MSSKLPSIAHASLDQITGGAGAQPPAPPKPISLDATNGLLEHMAESFGWKPSGNAVNGTKVPRETHEAVGKLLGAGKR